MARCTFQSTVVLLVVLAGGGAPVAPAARAAVVLRDDARFARRIGAQPRGGLPPNNGDGEDCMQHCPPGVACEY